MQALTRFVLRHKALVALAWLVVAVAGAATIGGTTHRMTNNFAMPGQAYAVDNQIVAEYGNGGSQTPYVPVLTAAPGERMTEPAVAAEAGRVFDAMAASVPDARLVDYGSTASRRFVTGDGRTSFALIFAPRDERVRRRRRPVPGDQPGRDGGAADGLAIRPDRRGSARQRRARVEGHRAHRRDDHRVGRGGGDPGFGLRLVPGPAAAAGRRGFGTRPRS